MTHSPFEEFGLELEVHAARHNQPMDGIVLGTELNRQIEDLGKVEADAGLGLVELITHPMKSIEIAVGALAAIEDVLKEHNVELYHTVYRPQAFGPAQWTTKPRYEALIQAAQRERPETWHLIEQMTGLASVHVNMSGPGFDPLAPEGQLIMNVLRNAGPHIAAYIHDKIGYGHGHMSMWDFADMRRMPDWNRWHIDFEDFNEEFAGKPRFVGETDHGSGHWQALPTGNCSVYDLIDLGTYWDFARPKLINGTKRKHYLEIRVLPSMSTNEIMTYATILHKMCVTIFDWHNHNKRFEPVTKEEAPPLFALLHANFGDIFPEAPLAHEKWKFLLHR